MRTKYIVKEFRTPLHPHYGKSNTFHNVSLETFNKQEALDRVADRRNWYRYSSIYKGLGFEEYNWYIVTEQVADPEEEAVKYLVDNSVMIGLNEYTARYVVNALKEGGYFNDKV